MKRHLILAFALLASSVALNAVNSLPDDGNYSAITLHH